MKRSIKVQVGRAASDPEKLVLPGVVLCFASHPHFDMPDAHGFTLTVGWWDFYIRLVWLSLKEYSQ